MDGISTHYPPELFSNPALIAGIIKTYQDAFAGHPWYEEYSEEKVEAHLREVMDNRAAAVTLCLQDDFVRAFAWGHSMEFWCSPQPRQELSPEGRALLRGTDELEKKLDAPGIFSKVSAPLFYLSEFAVSPQFQRQRIGGKLLMAVRLMRQWNNILLRTKQDSPMSKLVLGAGGRVLMPTLSGGRIMMSLPCLEEIRPGWH